MNNTRIRLANINTDLVQIQALLSQLGYPQHWMQLQSKLAIFEADEASAVYVLEASDTVIGVVALICYESLLYEGKNARIEALVVDDAHRGKGFGKQLISYIEEHAKTKGCVIIELTSGLRRANMGTHRFYQSLGYQNTGELEKVYLRKKLR